MGTPVFDAPARAQGQRAALLTNLFAPSVAFIVTGPMMILYASDVLAYEPKRITGILALLPLIILLRIPLLGPIERLGKRRTMLVGDLIRIAAVAAMLLLPADLQPFAIFVGLLLAFQGAMQLGKGTIWQPLLRDITTGNDRGRFFARMRFCFTFVQVASTLLIALMIGDRLSRGEYQLLLVAVLAILVWHVFWSQRIPSHEAPRHGRADRLPLWEVIRTAPLLRRPLLLTLLVGLGQTPVFIVYAKQVLQLSSDLVTAFVFIQTSGAALSLLVWGRVADALGYRPMLIGLQAMNLLLLPLLLMAPVVPEGSWSIEVWFGVGALMLWGFFTGSITAGVGICTVSVQHHFAQPRTAIQAMGLFATVVMLVQAGVTTATGWIVQGIVDGAQPVPMLDGFLTWDGMKGYLLATGVVVAVAVILLVRRLPNMRTDTNVADFFSSLLAAPMRVLYRSRQIYHEDVRRRVQTARWLGRDGSPLAVEPLEALLDDPSYEVRVEAVRSLGATTSQSAARPLRALLEDPEHQQVWEHCAHALGEIGDAAALPLLRERASDGDQPNRIRAACVGAMGLIGDDSAIPLIAAVVREDPPPPLFLRAACCRALLRLDARSHASLILDVLHSMEQRFDRHELITLLCTWLDLDTTWMLRGSSSIARTQLLLAHSPAGDPQLRHALEERDLIELQACWRRLAPETDDPVVQAVAAQLLAGRQWNSVCPVAGAWLLLR